MSADEDIFASLGGSLMSDLLKDLNALPGADGATYGTTSTIGSTQGSANANANANTTAVASTCTTAATGGTAGGGGGSDDTDALSSLERELAALQGIGAGAASGSSGPPGMRGSAGRSSGGGMGLSAAGLVVASNAAKARPFPPPPQAAAPQPAAANATATNTGAANNSASDDAWAQSLAKFSSLQGLADDFVAADTAKKQQAAINTNTNLVDNLFANDGNDNTNTNTNTNTGTTAAAGNQTQAGGTSTSGGGYDISEKIMFGNVQIPPPQKAMPPPPAMPTAAPAPPSQSQPSQLSQPAQPPPLQPPTQQQLMMAAQQQHSQMMMAQQQAQQQQFLLAQQRQREQAEAYQRHVQQQQAVAALQHQQFIEKQQKEAARMQKQQAQQQQPKQQPKHQEVAFLKKDFPSLGGTTEEEEESKEEERPDEPLIAAPGPTPTPIPPQGQSMPPVPPPYVSARLAFDNPDPGAPPINANSLRSYFMTPRDLCYVVHSMMRPLATLDPFTDDYYRWGYDERAARNLLMLGPNASANARNLPNPVWKETKVKAQEIEDKFRTNVEKRADKWSEKKQTLGKTVKVNVKRPKALLATTGALSSFGSAEDESKDNETRSEEDTLRLSNWTARLAIDRGYMAYLDLLETRRLLQTAQSGGPANDAVAERRVELTRDVEANVAKLHSSLGITSIKDADTGERSITVDGAILARTLSMPKGRMLLSRVLDEGVLPFSSACRVLPKALGVILSTPIIAGAAPKGGEDRLIRSLIGLIQTQQPSLDPQDLIDCLVEFSTVHAASQDPKAVIGGQRPRMELLHSVLSRGGVVCTEGSEYGASWKSQEANFMAALATMQ